MQAKLLKLLGLIAYLIVCVSLGELLVRFVLQFTTIYDVEMTRYELELKVPSDHPEISFEHIANKRADLMGVPLNINSQGFRDREYALERSGARRVIVLGDSITFGWGVKKEDTYEEILEQELSTFKPTELINFAHGNYNTVQQVALFEQKGLQYQPDLVLLFYNINDAEPNPLRGKWWFLGYSRMFTLGWSRFRHLLSGKVLNYKEYYSALYHGESKGWLATKDAFSRLRKLCKEKNIALRVLLLPELHQLEKYAFTAEHKLLGSFLSDLEISYLDLAPKFSNIKSPHSLWVAADDAHPNALGHSLIAKYSFEFVKNALEAT